MLLVVVQPAVNANSAVALITLNETRICFMFLVSFWVRGYLAVLEMGFTEGRIFVFKRERFSTYYGWRGRAKQRRSPTNGTRCDTKPSGVILRIVKLLVSARKVKLFT